MAPAAQAKRASGARSAPNCRPRFTSIACFNRTVEIVLLKVSRQRVLDDDDDGVLELCDALALDVLREIRQVDSAAVAQGLFWHEIVSSIQMGDFLPQVVAAAKRRRRGL